MNRSPITPADRLSKAAWLTKLKAHLEAHPVDPLLMAAIHASLPMPEVILTHYDDAVTLHDAIRHALTETLADDLQSSQENTLCAGLGLLGLPFPDAAAARRHIKTAPKGPEQQVFSAWINSLLAPFMQAAQPNRSALRWLYGIVVTWNRSRAQTPPHIAYPFVPTLRIRKPEPNPAMEDDAAFLHLMRLLSAFESGALPALHWRTMTPELQLGGFVFFSIVLGGLVHEGRRQMVFKRACLQALDEPYASMLLPRDRLLDIQELHRRHAVQAIETFRWIPDPVSARLHHKFSHRWRQCHWDSRLPSKCLKAFLSHLQNLLQARHSTDRSRITGEEWHDVQSALDALSSVRRLSQASRVYQRRRLPAMIWHHLEGDYETHDLNVTSLTRLHVFKPRGLAPARLREPIDPPPQASGSETDLEAWACHWVAAAIQLMATPKKDSTEPLGVSLKRLEESLDLPGIALIHQLTGWLKALASDHALSTQQRTKWVSTLLPSVVGHFTLSENLNDLDNEERIEEFDDMAACANYNATDLKHFFEAWVSLHNYLIAAGEIAERQARFVRVKERPRVDAQYVSEIEFERAKVAIGQAPLTSDMKNICLLVMIISYRMGLRRSEVTKLATHHVALKDGDLDVLRVAWWDHRRLKTPSSTRTLPIRGLLTPDEASWLYLWTMAKRHGARLDVFLPSLSAAEQQIKARQFSVKPLTDKASFLFLTDNCLSLARDREIQVAKIVRHVQAALKAALGTDEHIRFHHLRHACATNTLLLLFANQLPNSVNFALDLMCGPDNLEERFKDFKNRVIRLRQALLSGHGALNSDLYATSRLLGHSSPITTLKSYTHCVDLLTGAAIHERFTALPKSLQIAIHPDDTKVQNRKRQSLKSRKNSHTLNEYHALGRPKQQS